MTLAVPRLKFLGIKHRASFFSLFERPPWHEGHDEIIYHLDKFAEKVQKLKDARTTLNGRIATGNCEYAVSDALEFALKASGQMLDLVDNFEPAFFEIESFAALKELKDGKFPELGVTLLQFASFTKLNDIDSSYGKFRSDLAADASALYKFFFDKQKIMMDKGWSLWQVNQAFDRCHLVADLRTISNVQLFSDYLIHAFQGTRDPGPNGAVGLISWLLFYMQETLEIFHGKLNDLLNILPSDSPLPPPTSTSNKEPSNSD